MKIAVVAVMLLGGVAHAQPSLTPAAPPPDEQVTSYYRLTLAADAASLGLFLAGAASEGPGGRDTSASSNLMGMGLLGFSLATPIIHASRGHWGRVGASLGLRTALPMLGAMVAVGINRCDSSKELFCELDYVGPGIVAGFVVASVIDANFLTEERGPAPTWAPQINASRHGMQLGVALAF